MQPQIESEVACCFPCRLSRPLGVQSIVFLWLHGCRVDKKQLRESLITRTIVTPEGNIKRELNPETATLTRDTLAKTIYARLFDWLVPTSAMPSPGTAPLLLKCCTGGSA